MDKLKMHSPDITEQNIEKLLGLFPNCKTEKQSDSGDVEVGIDFDLLKQELSKNIVEGAKERYQLNWPGKKEALLTANAPIAKTLRPCREESVNFDTTENLFIEGDNLDALKLLQETYLGKVKMIYIDPPYNTGNDFIYDDDFVESTDDYLQGSGQKDEKGNRLIANTDSNGRFHSDWLSMIYSRLRLSKNLLMNDGFIFISIDDGEALGLKKICDEIFGEENFVECLIWKKKYGGGAKTKYFVGLHEYVFCYCKTKSLVDKIEIPYAEENRKYYKYTDEKESLRGPYRLQPLNTNSNDRRENLIYPIIFEGEEVWPESQWQWSRERAETAQANNEVVVSKTKKGVTVNFKQYLRNEEGEERKTKPFSIIDGIYTQHGTSEIKSIFGNGKIFSFPKPSSLIKSFLKILPDNDYLVLDFFAGSSSTAHAVMKLNAEDSGNRKFIMVQLPEICDEKSEASKAGYKTIAEISKERIRRAGTKVKEENPEATELDIGFRVLKIDSSNMNEVHYTPDTVTKGDLLDQIEHIKPERSAEDLLFQVMLDWGVDLSLPIRSETIGGKTVYFVKDDDYAPCDLVACFDKDIDETLIKHLAGFEPLRVVFRDDGFVSDSVKINAEQIFKQLSPTSDIKAI